MDICIQRKAPALPDAGLLLKGKGKTIEFFDERNNGKRLKFANPVFLSLLHAAVMIRTATPAGIDYYQSRRS
jgi:hypothetical protein